MFSEQIAAGIKWLNQIRPQWFDKVNLDTLNLGKCSLCVLGQLFGDEPEVETEFMYTAGFGYAQARLGLTDRICQSLGFAVDHSLPNSELRYEILTNEWKEAIRSLRSPQVEILSETLEEATEKQIALAS